MALTSPHFEATDVERIRAQVSPSLRDTTNPTSLASRKFLKSRLATTPMAGQQTVRWTACRRSTADLKDYVRRVIAKDGLRIAVVGDVDADTLGEAARQDIRRLACQGQPDAGPDVMARNRRSVLIRLDVPQTVVTFGGPGILRHDPDFMAGLRRQPHPRWWWLSSRLPTRSPREARAGLFGL
jgi:zinc protease